MSTTSTVRVPTLRTMGPQDVAAVARLEAAVYPQPWSATLFQAELGRDDRRYVTVHDGDRLLGYGGVLVLLDEAHITTVVVDPDARGQGLGARILLELLQSGIDMGATAATLEVRAGNVAANRLYTGFGFAPVGVRPRYYADTDEDAIIMWLHDIDGTVVATQLRGRRAALDAEGTV